MDVLRIAQALRDIAEALETPGPFGGECTPKPSEPSSAKMPKTPKKEDSSPGVAEEEEGDEAPKSEVTLKDLQDLAAALLRGKRKPQLMGVLGDFKLKNLSSAKPKDFPALLAALQEAQDA